MDAKTARFLIERGSNSGEWLPVTRCNTVWYARMVARWGGKTGSGNLYRIIEERTGRAVGLRAAAG